MNNESRLFGYGFKPVVKMPGRPWKRLPGPLTHIFNEKSGFVVQFSHNFTGLMNKSDVVYFALSYPFTYEDSIKKFNEMCLKYKDSDKIYVHQETAIYSIEGRKMQLITISSKDNITKEREDLIPNLFPEHDPIKSPRPFK